MTAPRLPVTHDTAARVLKLYLYLQGAGKHSNLASLAQYLGVSSKTVERYLKAIEGVTGERFVHSKAKEWDWNKYRNRMPRAKRDKFNPDMGDL